MIYESEINEVMIQSMNPKITVMKYEINPRSEKGISLGKVEGCVINNKGIQIYNKENSYKVFLSNYVKHMTWELKLRDEDAGPKKQNGQ